MNRLRPTALVIDDEPDIRELLELTLDRMDVTTITAENLTQARALLAEQRFDLCLTDMRLPDGNGIDLVDHIQKNYPDTPVAVITAHGNMAGTVSDSAVFEVGMSLAEMEKRLILRTLRHHDYDKNKTAMTLQIGLATLYRKIQEYGLET